MLKIDDKKKEVRTVEKKTCRRINMHFEWGLVLNFFLIHVIGQVSKWILEASMGCPWVEQNEINEDRNGKLIKIYL